MKTQETVCISPSSVVPTVKTTDRHVLRVPNHMEADYFGGMVFCLKTRKAREDFKTSVCAECSWFSQVVLFNSVVCNSELEETCSSRSVFDHSSCCFFSPPDLYSSRLSSSPHPCRDPGCVAVSVDHLVGDGSVGVFGCGAPHQRRLHHRGHHHAHYLRVCRVGEHHVSETVKFI